MNPDRLNLRARGDGLSEETCRRLTLIATVLGSSMAYVTAVNVAIPAIGADLEIGFDGQQWILLSYSLALASLYPPTGPLPTVVILMARYCRTVVGGSSGCLKSRSD